MEISFRISKIWTFFKNTHHKKISKQPILLRLILLSWLSAIKCSYIYFLLYTSSKLHVINTTPCALIYSKDLLIRMNNSNIFMRCIYCNNENFLFCCWRDEIWKAVAEVMKFITVINDLVCISACTLLDYVINLSRDNLFNQC